MNRDRRKALGSVFFDVAKYLLTTTAVGSFVVKDVKERGRNNFHNYASQLQAAFV